MELIWLKEANYLEDYKIRLLFNTGQQGTVDLEEFLVGPIFELLKNKEEFKKFHLNEWTLEWENGADFAPEFLYELAMKTKSQVKITIQSNP